LLLKVYIYAYLNRVVSRRLEREAQRKVE